MKKPKLKYKKSLIFGNICNMNASIMICSKCKKETARIHFLEQGQWCQNCVNKFKELTEKHMEEFDELWTGENSPNYFDNKLFIARVKKETSEFERDQLRQKLTKALKEVHGGGNGKRILTQLLKDI